MNKLMTRFLAGLLTATGVLGVAACGDDDDEPKPTNSLYQEYAVVINNGTAMAYANLRVASPAGSRVALSSASSLTVNDKEMLYTPQMNPETPPYLYSYPLAADTNTLTFTLSLANGSKMLSNSVRLQDVPDQKIDLPLQVVTGEPLKITVPDGQTFQYGYTAVYLTDMMSNETAATATVSPSGTATFSKLPESGRYLLVVETLKNFNTTANDTPASGNISVTRFNSQIVDVVRM